MTSATNPESGVTSFVHDDNGNLTKRNSGDGAVVDIAYDWLNRPISKTYSGPRAGDAATLCYDGEVFNGSACAAPTAPKVAAGNSKMRMTEARNAKSSTQYLDFDPMGRVRKSQQTTGGKDYIFDYTYNAAGAMETMRYPDGRVVTYGIDGMGRVSSVSWGSGVRQVTGLEYEANGALKKMVLGNGATESWQYSRRGGSRVRSL